MFESISRRIAIIETNINQNLCNEFDDLVHIVVDITLEERLKKKE